ncbi:hypothetical protein [Cupriavidus sp. CP313]
MHEGARAPSHLSFELGKSSPLDDPESKACIAAGPCSSTEQGAIRNAMFCLPEICAGAICHRPEKIMTIRIQRRLAIAGLIGASILATGLANAADPHTSPDSADRYGYNSNVNSKRDAFTDGSRSGQVDRKFDPFTEGARLERTSRPFDGTVQG